MENQLKLTSSKEVIGFLVETFPACFCAEGEMRPLKIGIFQDLVERVQGQKNLSKTQLRSALRVYTSSWRYLHGIKPGAVRVDLDGNPCGDLEEQHIVHARKQLEEAKARVQARRMAKQQERKQAQQQEKQQERKQAQPKAVETKSPPLMPREGKTPRKVFPQQGQAKTEQKAEQTVKPERRLLSASDISMLTPGQAVKVIVGKSEIQATVQEVVREGVRVLLASGMSMIVRAEHLMF